MEEHSGELQGIADTFAQTFSTWGLRLPQDALTTRERGSITERGWWIQYLFGLDELGDYVDFYAAHRMTDDRHVRLRADGSAEHLPSIQSLYVTSEDPAEAKRLEDEYLARNRAVKEMLSTKGFICR